jgi:TPR repeat protein
MKANRLIFTLLLASSIAVVRLGGQQTKADEKPIDEVKARAKAGDAELQAELGVRYEHGKDVAKDQVEAVKWYRKAAEQNNAEAQYNLGVCYAEGVAKNEREALFGAARDPGEAVKWYRKAAEQNFAKAEYNLGVCYAEGKGVAQDPVEAVKWYRKAAEQNNADAQYKLGMCFEYGRGVAEDSVEAYKWLLLSARQGDEGAKAFLTVMESKMLKAEQIAEGQKRARDFKPH